MLNGPLKLKRLLFSLKASYDTLVGPSRCERSGVLSTSSELLVVLAETSHRIRTNSSVCPGTVLYYVELPVRHGRLVGQTLNYTHKIMASRSFPELALAVELLQQGLFKPEGRSELCSQYRYYNEHKFEQYLADHPGQKQKSTAPREAETLKDDGEKDQRKCRSDNALLKQFSSNFISLGADPEDKKWDKRIKRQMTVFQKRIQLCDGYPDEGAEGEYEESPHSTRPQRRQMRLLMETARAGLPLFGVAPAGIERQLTVRLLTLCGRPEACFEDAYSELIKPGLDRLQSQAATPTTWDMDKLEAEVEASRAALDQAQQDSRDGRAAELRDQLKRAMGLVGARRARDYAGDLVSVATTRYDSNQHLESYESDDEPEFEASFTSEVGAEVDDKADIEAGIGSQFANIARKKAQKERNYAECPQPFGRKDWSRIGMPKAFWARLLCILWDCDFEKMLATLGTIDTRGLHNRTEDPADICAGSTKEALKTLSPEVRNEIGERHLMTKYWHWQLAGKFKIGDRVREVGQGGAIGIVRRGPDGTTRGLPGGERLHALVEKVHGAGGLVLVEFENAHGKKEMKEISAHLLRRHVPEATKGAVGSAGMGRGPPEESSWPVGTGFG